MFSRDLCSRAQSEAFWTRERSMSMLVQVFVRNLVPSPAEVQSALDDLGFGLSIVDIATPFDDGSGFRPIIANIGDERMETGVEIYVDTADALPKGLPLAIHPQLNRVIRFRWGSRYDEGFCALAVSAAVAKVADGVIVSDALDTFASLEEIVGEARSMRELIIGMQAPPQERTEWRAQFLTAVQELFPDYQLNDGVGWPCTELTREVEGLFHSLSSYRSVDGQYGHYFAVCASAPSGNPPLSPFLAGGRNGHGYDIWNAFSSELPALLNGPNRVRGVQSTHQRRRGCEDIVRGCTMSAETHLGRNYRDTLRRATPFLLKCIELVTNNPPMLSDTDKRAHYQAKFEFFPLTASGIAFPPPDFDRLTPEALVYAAPEAFERQDELQAIARRLKTLGPH